MTDTVSPIKRNLPSTGFPVRRFFAGVFMTLAFIAISSAALISALGYKVNWAAGSIQQTGLLEVDTKYAVAADVYLNGELQDKGVPFRKNWMLPGTYTLKVVAEGYVPWERQIQIKENERTLHRNIILLYQAPPAIVLPVVRQEELQPKPDEQRNIEVLNGNELWINEKFVTRTSEDILGVRWFADHEHVIYQVGNRIVLSESDGSYTQDVLTLTTNTPTPFQIREGGRVLIYEEGPLIKGVELFERTGLIDRLAAVRKMLQG